MVHIPGVVICNEAPSQSMGEVITSTLQLGHGFWFNEGWMLLAYRKNPQHPRPGWWTDSDESIDAYWKMLETALTGVQ